MDSRRDKPLPSVLCWTWQGRLLVFVLSASSIWCLLADLYNLCSMQIFTVAILLPATAAMLAVALVDRSKGDGQLWRAAVVGAASGLIAAVAYDVFRLPFVFAHQLQISSIVPPLDLFKVFPRFGAMIFGQPIEQEVYPLITQLVGWAYHFSNGLTFGVMYMAMIGDSGRRSWLWAILLATGLEMAMLLTPYPRFFAIPVTAAFVVATFAAHFVFGIALGRAAKRLAPATSQLVPAA